MKAEDIILNSVLSLFVGLSAIIIREYFDLEIKIIIIICFLIISIFWMNSLIKEIKKRSINNSTRIRNIEKDLNINKRLSKLEIWKENMIKKNNAQIDITDLIKIIGVLIVGYILLSYCWIYSS